MLILSLIGHLSYLLGVMFLSARLTLRTAGRGVGIIRGALVLYSLSMVGSFLFTVVIPGILIAIGADKDVIVSSFPEAICNVPMVLFGWGPALVFAVLVRHVCDRKTDRLDRNANS